MRAAIFRSTVPVMLAVAVLLFVATNHGQATQDASARESGSTPGSPETPATQAQREQAFAQLLRGAVLEGTWQMTGEGGLSGNAPLSESKPEKYTIVSAEKGLGDNWVISARIQFGDTDVTVPVPVRVLWAEDTPMVTINDLAVPLVGTYSARVVFHKGFYSGVWYSNAKNYGGVMAGRVVKAAAPDPPGRPRQGD